MSPVRHPGPPSPSADASDAVARKIGCVALLGNPNTGKTTLFNRLCGLRSKTANFPGSTVEARFGRLHADDRSLHLVDLPGIYGLNLDRPESKICKEYLAGTITLGPVPEAAIVVTDAANLGRNLIFVNQALQQSLPLVIALNMMDLADRRGIVIDTEELSRRLGCPVVPICARRGAGVEDLVDALDDARLSSADLADPSDARAAQEWAASIIEACVVTSDEDWPRRDRVTDRLDAICTHPVLGLVVFAALMTGLFYTIFTLAAVPMDLIELLFGILGEAVTAIVPAGAIRDLLVNGVVGGVAGTVVFLPQICLLFFLISILEDTGYLARAVFVTDRLLRRFGLPGQAFVPLLSAHACAIPAIMSTRLIPDPRQRIATILVAPFMSCSARLPVYVLLVGILFRDDPLLQGLAFTGCYVLGAAAALFTALIARRTLLKGAASGMVIELPPYRRPSLRTALVQTLDRAVVFLRKAGTVILAMCIILWWLSAYPAVDEPPAATALRAQARQVAPTSTEDAAALTAEADALAARHAMAGSFAGRIGRTAAPVFKPIGLDWQLTIGVMTSFAAREVFVSTLAVIFAGTDDTESESVLKRIELAKRDDGTFVFDMRTAASLLVFYVLAMQCLPTLPVTAREAGHWGWAALQLGYMSSVAYAAAWLMYVGLGAAGIT